MRSIFPLIYLFESSFTPGHSVVYLHFCLSADVSLQEALLDKIPDYPTCMLPQTCPKGPLDKDLWSPYIQMLGLRV